MQKQFISHHILLALLPLALTCCKAACSEISVADAKMLPNGEHVSLAGQIVSFAQQTFFYIQDPNRSAGIRVEETNHGLVTGLKCDVTGIVQTNSDGERYIQATDVAKYTDSYAPVKPLFITGANLGGSNWHYDPITGAGQKGVEGGLGLNNVGLLVRIAGKVTYADRQRGIAYVDDGSHLNDSNGLGENGESAYGVRILLPDGISMPSVGTSITLTGISSTALVSRKVVRAVHPGSFTGEMIFVPACTFVMGNTMVGDDLYSVNTWSWNGDELPQHEVTLKNGYWIGKYEITRAEYRQFINAGGYYDRNLWSVDGWNWRLSNNRTLPENWAPEQNWGDPPGQFTQTERHPVVGVSYYEGEAFCKWAGGSLPTEAEWEMAARWTGTSELIYPWGNIWKKDYCNDTTDTFCPLYMTTPVGSYPNGTSPCGCMDMAGNVWEWCKDWYLSTYFSQMPNGGWIDPQGPAYSPQGWRILRGGSWYFGAPDARCGNRYYCMPGSHEHYYVGSWFDVGIRLRL